MNNNEETKKKDTKKNTETLVNAVNRAADFSKKAASSVQESAKALSEKIKADNQDRKKKKFNSLFPEDVNGHDFHLPNIIKIVDDAVRRDEELCDGAIGWRDREKGTEILFLYDEAKDALNIRFVPTFECNSIYCVDPFDRGRFIKADCIFSKAQEEKLAELENIAYCLGAKSCSIEIQSSEGDKLIQSRGVALGIGKKEGGIKASVTERVGSQSTGKTTVLFAGHDHPKRPKLKWFTHDDTINNLIAMRCKEPASVKLRTLHLSGSSSASMNQQTAIAVDCLIKKTRGKVTSTMEALSAKERSSNLVFEVEF